MPAPESRSTPVASISRADPVMAASSLRLGQVIGSFGAFQHQGPDGGRMRAGRGSAAED